MYMPETKLALAKQIEREISDYTTKVVTLGNGITYSQHKLVQRIVLFESKTYPTGKFDKQGNYKGWYDIITPRIDSEVKNIDFDTSNIEVYTFNPLDETANVIINLKNQEWMRETGQAEELNSAIEEGSGWGNVVWKKIKGGFERVDLRNFYVINQTAQSLEETPTIERHQLSQSDLRKLPKSYKNVDKVISECGEKAYKTDSTATENDTTTPYYPLFERNGEVCVKDLKEANGEEVLEGDEHKYVLAKVIGAGKESGTSVTIKYILFAQEMAEMPYKEYHRGRYKGRWWREGLYELLFDIQVRSNEIGNQIARGLEWASKTIFRSKDKLIVQNILTDLKNGDFVRSEDLQQVTVRMQGLDQLIAEYNRLIQMANDLANSREIVQGITPASGTPLGTTQIVNMNAGKLFDFIREKISIPLREIFEEHTIPQHIEDIKAQDVLRLTGDSDMLRRLKEMIVENWYISNLIALGPHSKEVGEALKAKKLEEMTGDRVFLKEFDRFFQNYKPRVAVIITGENVNLEGMLASLATFIQLELDPVRRSYLIEKAMRLKGIDTGSLPRSTPEQLMGPAAAPQERGKEPVREPATA